MKIIISHPQNWQIIFAGRFIVPALLFSVFSSITCSNFLSKYQEVEAASQVQDTTQSILYVSTSGNDSNSGTQESPLATLRQAVAVAPQLKATEIRMAHGVYYENLNITSDLTIKGSYCSGWASQNINDSACLTSIRTRLFPALPVLTFSGSSVTKASLVEQIELNYEKVSGSYYPPDSRAVILRVMDGATPVFNNNRIVGIAPPSAYSTFCGTLFVLGIEVTSGSSPEFNRLWLNLGNYPQQAGCGSNRTSHAGFSVRSGSSVKLVNSVIHIFNTPEPSIGHYGVYLEADSSINMINNTLGIECYDHICRAVYSDAGSTTKSNLSRLVNNILAIYPMNPSAKVCIDNSTNNGFNEIRNNALYCNDNANSGSYRILPGGTLYAISDGADAATATAASGTPAPVISGNILGNTTNFNGTLVNGPFTNTTTFATSTALQLPVASPAANAGINTAGEPYLVTDDILGVARPVGAAYDIGAYESR